jgi:hypothetical protein
MDTGNILQQDTVISDLTTCPRSDLLLYPGNLCPLQAEAGHEPLLVEEEGVHVGLGGGG